MPLRPPRSLRSRLLWSLLAAILLTAMTQAFIAYRSARAEADEIFDYHMEQMAMSLRAGLPMGSAQGAVITDQDGYDFVVQVWTTDGQSVFRSGGVALAPRSAPGFSNVEAGGANYRVFSMRAGAQVIQVAQDMAAREDMAGALALRVLLPIALMAPPLMLVVWWVVSSALAPVARVRRQVAQRQADDLTEVSPAGLPDEIRPLVLELNLLFARVRQAFDAQKNFVADAAHELRSPLAALRLQVQGLQRATDDASRALAVSRLTAGIDRATRLVEQLLVLARHQAGAAGGLAARPVALSDLVRQAVADVNPDALARGVDLGVTHADDAPIQGHPDALRILVRNLLDNAVKYAPAGGRVDLEVRRMDGTVRLLVEDSGPGIPDADRARVLDRFYRVPGSASGGSGLGLAIVKSIADLHDARLALGRSARLGGLRVELDFPALP